MIVTKAFQKAPANSVPAAAVIRGGQVLFTLTGRKECNGDFCVVRKQKLGPQPFNFNHTKKFEFNKGYVELQDER